MSPPLYSETTRATTFLYNNTKPALLPDKTYAWRVRAISTTGISENSVFRNNGYSEIYNFRTTQNCDAPKFPLSEAINKSTVKINWQGNLEHNKYHVQYRKVSYTQETDKQKENREKKNKKRAKKEQKEKEYTSKKENFEWFEVYTQNEQAQISNLETGQTYEFRVGGTCTSLTEFKQYYSYTNTNEFTMPTNEETVNYNCGVLPDIQIANQDPIQNIGVNETFTAGDFPVTVIEIQNNGGKFTGKGFIVVPYLADTKIAVAFDGITIKTNYQLIEGVVQTTYDPTWGSSVNVLINGFQDSINNILDLLENYTGSEEDIKALQDAINGLNTEMDGIQGNASIPDEIKAPISEELQGSFNSSAENLTAQEENPKPETKEEAKDKLSQIKEAINNVSNSLNAGSEQGDRTEDPKGFFDGYLPLKNNDTALTIKNLDNGGAFTIPIKASNESQTFYQDYTVNLNGTTYTIIYTSSISSAEEIEKARAKVNTPENGVVIYYHYDTDNNRLGYKVEVDKTYFGNNLSDEDFDFSKKTFKEGLNNLIAELKAVDDWSAEIFEITVGLNNRIKQLLNVLVLPEEMWNPDNAIYNEVPVHFKPLPAGLIDGVLEEVKSVPLLISLVIDYNTSKETQQKIDALVSDFDFTDAMDKWYESRKDLYTSGPAHIIEYRTGKDVVGVGTLIGTGGLASLGKIKKSVNFIEELTSKIKKTGNYLNNLAKYKTLFKEGKIAELFSELKKTTAFPNMGNTKVRNHTDLINEYKTKYGETASNYPYSKSNPVTDFELAETGYFVRVYSGAAENVNRSWVFRIEDLRKYRDVDELMEKLALPIKPKRIALVELPPTTKLRKSIAGSQEWLSGLKQVGGGVQYEILTKGNPPRNWFEDLLDIDEFLK